VKTTLNSPLRLARRDWLLPAITGVSSLFSAAVVYFAWPFSRKGVQKYKDLIVGEITFSDSYKSGDYLLSYLAVACFVLSWIVLLLASRRLLRGDGAAEQSVPLSESAASFPQFWGITAFAFGILLVRREVGILELGLLALILLSGFCWALGVFRKRQDPVAKLSSLFWLVLTSIFCLFSILGLAALATFLSPAASLLSGQMPILSGYAVLVVVLALAACMRLPDATRTRMTQWLQLCVPLLILVGFTRIFNQDGLLSGNEVPLATKLVALLVAFAGVFMNLILIRRPLEALPTGPKNQRILLPTVVAIAGFLAFKTPEYLSFDFFHVGESLIAWQQIAELGKFPYSGYAIQRGFVDLIPGLLNRLFFDGTFASYNSAFALWWLLEGAVASWLLCRLVGNGWGLVLTLCLAPLAVFKLWFFLPIILILAHPVLLAKPLRWLVVWFYCSLVHCLCQHIHGIAMTIGTMPVAVWILVEATRGGVIREAWQHRRSRVLSGLVACLVTLLLLAPLLKEWVFFILEQGGANEIANGIVLGQRVVVADWFRWQNPLVWELFRSGGWLIGVCLLWHLFMRERLILGEEGKRWYLTPAAVVCLAGIVSAVIFVPYSMGRIDPKGLSRPGSIMQLLIGCLIPLVLILSSRFRSRVVTYAAVGLLLGIAAASEYTDIRLLPGRAVAALVVPQHAIRIAGSRIGLPNLGNLLIPPEKLQDIVTVKQVMDVVLRDGETYLDLTNNMAFYTLLGKEVPSVYAGYYIATSQKIQQRMLAALTPNPPPLVWVGPARTFGGGTAALRSYRLYRWVMKNDYLPFSHNGAQFLVRRDRYHLLGLGAVDETERLRGLVAAFPDKDLGQLPVAWGRSYPLLAKRFTSTPLPPAETATEPHTLAVPEVGLLLPARLFSIRPKEPVAGNRWDFMTFTIATQLLDNLPLKVRIRWTIPGEQPDDDHAVTFLAQKGVPLLIPLGASPTWLLSPQIGALTIEVADLGGGGDCTLRSPTLLSLQQ
jgi:hypothetical protein